MKIRASILLVIFCGVLLGACSERDDLRGKYSAGMTKAQVVKAVGQPVTTQSLTKTKEQTMDNQYWQTIPEGVRVEVWEYRDHFGRHLLYFTNSFDSVAGFLFLSNGQPF